MSERIFLGGLWSRDTAKAGQVISGPFMKARLVLFTNKKKAKDSDPDFYAYIEEPQSNNDRHAKADAESGRDDEGGW